MANLNVLTQKSGKVGVPNSSQRGDVCLFWIRNRICPTGSTPKGEPTEISPTTQATCHLRASSLFLFPLPLYFVMHPASGPYLPLSCTYPPSSIWSVPCLFSCHTHIFKPHKKEPLIVLSRPVPEILSQALGFYQWLS